MAPRTSTRVNVVYWYPWLIEVTRVAGEIALIPDECPGWPLFRVEGRPETIGSNLVRILVNDGWLVVSRRCSVLGTVEALAPVSKEDYVEDLIARSPRGATAPADLREIMMSLSEEDLADVRRKVLT